MYKKIIIIIILIVVFALSFWFYRYIKSLPEPLSEQETEQEAGEEEKKEEKEEEQETEDEISKILNNLKKETGIGFSEIESAEFIWYVEGQDGTVQGKGFEVKGILSNENLMVEQFLENQGFEVDLYNISDGTIVGSVGYKKNQIVCVNIGRSQMDGQGNILDTGDIEVKCGKIDNLTGPEVLNIDTKKGNNFFITLETNPTTGYQWELDFDNTYIELVNREYGTPPQEIIGAGGNETFAFLALKSGETEITFSYLRSWEQGNPPIEEKVYIIIINE